MAAVLHKVAVDLGLDVRNTLCIGFQPSNVDFDIEVADVW